GPLLHKALQMLLIKLCAQEPVVELFRAFGKAENRNQEKRHGRDDGKHDPHASQAQADQAQQQPEQFQWILLQSIFLPYTVSTNFFPSISRTSRSMPYNRAILSLLTASS